ncbi:hypothetical protein HPC63_15355 [Treponema phagedenis]|nr:hypothetical protein [Treponema phagedenis]NVP23782.1 hypothetical protein [Treponema phagedenis]NVP23844.1 hypothetical protein [Treponema phagedenis]NVP24897.1 hypothetical protein [Treponema phagedenis]NVP25495.1 hypothetical protein [Treponema phagedenis]
MTGTQTLIGFVVAAALFTTYKITSKAFDYFGKKKKMDLELQKSKMDAEIKKEKNKTKQEELKKDVAVLDALSKTLEGNDRTKEKILKNLQLITDENSLKADGVEISKAV